MRFLFSATFLFYLCLQSAFAQDGLVFSVTGNVSRVNLVELYTSEGCSSCPPAEAWLSNLKNHESIKYCLERSQLCHFEVNPYDYEQNSLSL